MRSLLALVLLLGTAACDGSPTPSIPTPPPAVTPPPADTAAGPVARIAVAADDLGSRDAIVAIRGFYEVTSTPVRPFTGRLTSPRSVHILIDGQFVQLDGVIPGSLNEDGLLWTLLMHGGAVDGERLAFRPIVGEPVGPPPDAVFQIRFDSFGAVQPIQGLSPIRFDGSTSRGDGLSYVIEFGDGEVSTEPTATHRIDTSTMNPSGFLRSGLVTARMTVVDRFGRTDAESTSFPPFEVADCGCGSGWVSNEAGTFRRFEFSTRQGLNLTGRLYGLVPDQGTTPFVAKLSGERDILIVPQGSGVEFRGHIELGQNLMRMILTQTGGPDHGRVWTLLYDDGRD